MKSARGLAGFVATGGTALWRIAVLEKRMDQSTKEAREDRRRISKSRRSRRLDGATDRVNYVGVASSMGSGNRAVIQCPAVGVAVSSSGYVAESPGLVPP